MNTRLRVASAKDHNYYARACSRIDIAGESLTPGGSQCNLGVSDRGVTHAGESLTKATIGYFTALWRPFARVPLNTWLSWYHFSTWIVMDDLYF